MLSKGEHTLHIVAAADERILLAFCAIRLISSQYGTSSTSAVATSSLLHCMPLFLVPSSSCCCCCWYTLRNSALLRQCCKHCINLMCVRAPIARRYRVHRSQLADLAGIVESSAVSRCQEEKCLPNGTRHCAPWSMSSLLSLSLPHKDLSFVVILSALVFIYLPVTSHLRTCRWI